MIITGAAGTVTLADEHSAWPPPPLKSARDYQERKTRGSDSSPPQTILVVRPWSGSENSLSFTIVHLLAVQHQTLTNLHRADPPDVTVTYMGETWDGALLVYDGNPDPFEPTEYQAQVEIRRHSS